MPEFNRNDFSGGWQPSNDALNAPSNCLLDMKNVQLDENGALTLTRGTQKISGAVGTIHTLYSKTINATKYRYAVKSTGEVLRDVGGAGTWPVRFSGGNDARAAFASEYDFVLICSGNARKKDNETTVSNLGMNKPLAAPTIAVQQAYNLDIEGTNTNYDQIEPNETPDYSFSPSVVFFTDATTFRGIIENINVTDFPPLNTLSLSGGSIGGDNDTFRMPFRPYDSSFLEAVRIEILLETPSAPGAQVENYYFYEWINEDLPGVLSDSGTIRRFDLDDRGRFQVRGHRFPFNKGIRAWTDLDARRGDFGRAGQNSALDWRTVRGIRITVTATARIEVVTAEMVFFGGSKGPLSGGYEWVSVNVQDNGSYLAQSAASPISGVYWIDEAWAKITFENPGVTEPYATEAWIFRRGGKLNQFYRVGTTTNLTTPFDDNVSDDVALATNITLNEFLRSLQIVDTPDEIMDIVPNYFGRTIYFTFKEILISELNNPDSYDLRKVIKLSGQGGGSEIFMWAKKVTNSSLLIGTTVDIYEISGTLSELPDGVLDVVIRPLGVKYPPTCKNAAAVNSETNEVIYMASDGWRTIGPSGVNISLTGNITDLLYRGYSRYGYEPANIVPHDVNASFHCAITRSQLWVREVGTTQIRVLVLDFKRKYWRPVNLAPNLLFAEEDGTLIAAFSGDGFIREIDLKSSYLLDGTAKQIINIKFPIDNFGTPRNRKDTYTLKFKIDTGGDNVSINIYKDESPTVTVLTTTLNSNGLTEKFIDVSSLIGLVKSVQLEISSNAVAFFKLTDWSLDFDLRPEQQTYIRIPPNNLGTHSRKRFISFPIVIDTLGNNVTVTPVIDGISQTGTTINTTDKATYIYYFIDDKVGIDIGFIISAGNAYFEFYEVDWKESISEKLPVPTKFLLIPQDDYGVPNRKRHTSYKFVINTRGSSVTFTPRIDQTNYTSQNYTTSEKQVVEYFFDDQDIIGINIGGTLSGANPFEFYGPIRPQKIEVLPDRLRHYIIPENNYGVAAKKRVRTMPMVINTNGADVIFTPIVDNVSWASSTFNTPNRQTVFHYFTDDVFGVDFKGILSSNGNVTPFEFYGLEKPEEVQVLPVGKRYDQVGPVELSKIGKILAFRVRIVATGTSLPYTIFGQDDIINTGTITTVANKEKVYPVSLVKGVNVTTLRLELGGGATSVFHRFYVEFKVNLSGKETDSKWLKVA